MGTKTENDEAAAKRHDDGNGNNGIPALVRDC